MSDLAAAWKRSSFCADSTCVEVAFVDGDVLFRDGKNVDLPPLRFTLTQWDEFCAALTADELAAS
jgi:hypothetical protein